MVKRGKTVTGLEMHDPERVALDDVHFAAYNPRTIDDGEIAALKASMLEHGLVLNLVVQRKADDGTPLVLIGGHQRVRAARELCEENGWDVPDGAWAVVLDVDDRTAKRLNVALNRISGDFDQFKLGDLFGDMPDLTEEGALAIGFSVDEIDALVSAARDPEDLADELENSVGDLNLLPKIHTLTITFGTEAERMAAKALLRSLSAQGGDVGSAVLAALEEYEGSNTRGEKGGSE